MDKIQVRYLHLVLKLVGSVVKAIENVFYSKEFMTARAATTSPEHGKQRGKSTCGKPDKPITTSGATNLKTYKASSSIAMQKEPKMLDDIEKFNGPSQFSSGDTLNRRLSVAIRTPRTIVKLALTYLTIL
jgi:hypothetical protein